MFVILMIRRDDMMNRERKQRNRELLLKIEAMKEMDVRNDVIDNGRLMKQGMNMMNTKNDLLLLFWKIYYLNSWWIWREGWVWYSR